MDLIAYLLLLDGNATAIYASDGLCLPPARVEFVGEHCESQLPVVVLVRRNGRWTEELRLSSTMTLESCGRLACVQPALTKPQ